MPRTRSSPGVPTLDGNSLKFNENVGNVPGSDTGEPPYDEYSTSLVGAIDEGTGSTRFLIFSTKTCQVITYHQIKLEAIRPRPGWIELDATAILDATKECMAKTCEKLTDLNFDLGKIRAIGVTNQRETTVAWDKRTGVPLYNAIVWCDMRTEEMAATYIKKFGNKNSLQKLCGLVIHPYFSALKLRWLLDNVPEVQKAAKSGNLMVGTIDTWLIWNLTGGPDGGSFVTDVTNASRTMLMNVRSLKWDPKLLKMFDINPNFLAQIKSSSEIYGTVQQNWPLDGVPISGCLGDQQAALVGDWCFEPATCKNTYGTGCFLLANTGQKPIFSNHGLLTTVAYKFGPDAPACYALEGSIALAGACLDWLSTNLGFFKEYEECDEMLAEVADTCGVYFVPAFSGLYAPYWHPAARGLIIGLSSFTEKAHIIRAGYEAVCFQTRDILEAMCRDHQGSHALSDIRLFADGGMSVNDHAMQMQADLLGAQVTRSQQTEATSLGAAIAAGLAPGIDLWTLDEIKKQPPTIVDDFRPSLNTYERDSRYQKWKDAVERSKFWTRPRQSVRGLWPDVFQPVVVPGVAFFTGLLLTVAFYKCMAKS